MHHSREGDASRTASTVRTWLRLLLSLLIVSGLTFHVIHASPSVADEAAPKVIEILKSTGQLEGGAFAASHATPHCHSTASCAFLPPSPAVLLELKLESCEVTPEPSRHLGFSFADRQFRPPRLPAHI